LDDILVDDEYIRHGLGDSLVDDEYNGQGLDGYFWWMLNTWARFG
jgi:hypothetical protein